MPKSTSTILSLPISRAAPPYHLTPDPLFPTPASLLSLSTYEPPQDLASKGPVALKEGDPVPPSMLRRSRAIRGGGAFSYVSPLPLEFPYDIQEEGDEAVKRVGEETRVKPVTIEGRLAEYEPSTQYPVQDAGLLPSANGSTATTATPTADASVLKENGKSSRINRLAPTAYTSALRESTKFPPPELLSFSSRLHKEWLPQLNVGDAATLVNQGSGQDTRETAIRKQLVDVLGGRTVLAREDKEDGKDEVEKQGFAPWSLCYAGHQFGSFAGQLGDGRAISILSTPTTPEVAKATGFNSLELQLKGAGRSPFSRFADGLAVLRSSIREYLGAEAMAALRQPTSRALALVGIPDVKVRRETIETAAIVTRVAPTWIRIGNFEIQWYREEWESLRLLTSFVGRTVLSLAPPTSTSTSTSTSKGLGLAVLRDVSKRNAEMIAGWQAYGFMHGVMNTDNISVAGLCIDYGPYAFMDVFDPMHICNHSDDTGRYSFRNQPTMGLFAIDKLGHSLAEVMGCEESLAKSAKEGEFVEAGEGWAEKGKEEMASWKGVGLDLLKEVKEEFQGIFLKEYTRLMRLRFGLLTDHKDDFDLFSSFLTLLELHQLDYTNSFRLLSQYPGSVTSPQYDAFLQLLLPVSNTSQSFATSIKENWKKWFEEYDARLSLEEEVKAEGASEKKRKARMGGVNPRFTLRQWVLEEVIQKVDKEKDLKALDRVLELSQNPFEGYGEVELGEAEGASCLRDEEQERRRLCGVGSESMLGFQCSCSS